MASNELKLHELAWCKKENGIYKIGLHEKIYDTIGAVIEIKFPEPGLEIMPGEPIFTISGTNEDFALKTPVHGYYLEKHEDADSFHFNDENWLVMFEVK